MPWARGATHTPHPPRGGEGRRARRPRSRGGPNARPLAVSGFGWPRGHPSSGGAHPGPGRKLRPTAGSPRLVRGLLGLDAPPPPPVLCAVSSFTGRGARLRRALRAGGRGGIGVLGWVQMVGVCEEASRARPRLRTWRRPCRAAGPWAGPATPREGRSDGRALSPTNCGHYKAPTVCQASGHSPGQSCVPRPRAWPSTAQPSPWHSVEMQPRLPETPDSPTAHPQRGLLCLSHPVTRLLACWGPQCAGPERRDH